MKAISLKQPWANLIATGLKTIETRKWSTNYRGELLIASSAEPRIVPYGAIVALVDIVNVRKFEWKDVLEACCDWYEGYAWELANIRPVVPIGIKGKLNIYDVAITKDRFDFITPAEFRRDYAKEVPIDQ